MNRLNVILALATSLTLSVTCFGQMSADGPKVGHAVPKATGYNADGTPFEFTSLKGKHAVIVFGCLT